MCVELHGDFEKTTEERIKFTKLIRSKWFFLICGHIDTMRCEIERECKSFFSHFSQGRRLYQ